MGVIIDFFKERFGKQAEPAGGDIAEARGSDAGSFDSFRLTEIALFTAVDLIARTLSKCEFVTVSRNKEIRGAEYFLWNYKPNRHQTKAEFLTEMVSRLILRNEVLVFETSDRQLLIADSFGKETRAVTDDIFSGVTARGMSFGTFRSGDVIYLQYNNSSVTGLLRGVCESYSQLMQDAAEKYEQQAGHKVVLGIGAHQTGDKEFQEKLNNLLENDFKTFFRKKNAVLPLYKNFSYDEPTTDAKNKAVSEVSDLKQLRAEAFTAVGNAFHVPPAVVSGEASMLSDAMQTFVGNAVDPIAKMLEQEITVKRYGEGDFMKGDYLLIDTTYARHIDAVSGAVNLDKAIACGVLNPYRAQRYCNMLPCDEEWARKYYITKNYEENERKGGEE